MVAEAQDGRQGVHAGDQLRGAGGRHRGCGPRNRAHRRRVRPQVQARRCFAGRAAPLGAAPDAPPAATNGVLTVVIVDRVLLRQQAGSGRQACQALRGTSGREALARGVSKEEAELCLCRGCRRPRRFGRPLLLCACALLARGWN